MVIINKPMLATEQINLLKKELKYKTSRSGGKGGQNVNKVETKVEVSFDILHSTVLTDTQKEMVLAKLKSKITEEGLLKLSEDAHRSQLANKEAVVERLIKLIQSAFIVPKKRKPTKPTKSSKVKRGENKKKRSELKASRKKLF